MHLTKILMKKYISSQILLISFILLSFLIPHRSYGNNEKQFTIVNNGKPSATIVISATPTPSALLSALELQYHILRITGAELPIKDDNNLISGLKILVGDNRFSAELGFTGESLETQEYIIAFRPQSIVLIGKDWKDTEANRAELGRPMNCGNSLAGTRHKIDYWSTVGMPERGKYYIELPGVYDDQGTCYATYHFLEHFCGVRWYGPSRTNIIIPKVRSLVVEGNDIRRSPALKYRDALWSGNWHFMQKQWGPVSREEIYLFWRRLKLGGEKWAGNHTFHKQTLQNTFFEPEYQAKGVKNTTQLCYSNPILVQKVAQIARDFFDGKRNVPEGWKAVGNYFAIVPDDNIKFCQCEQCKELLRSDKDMRTGKFSSGEASNYIFSFINAVAKELQKTHPDKYISALAYWIYAVPPKFEIEPNVSVAPCLHTCYYAIHKEIYENDMMLYHEWLKKCKAPIFLWNYYHHPMEAGLIEGFKCFPNIMPHKTAEIMRKFIKDGVRGIFICGEQDMLEGYIIAKIWDDPSIDVDELIDEFFKLYFGSASEPMKQFYLTIEEIACNPNNYPPPYYMKNRIDWKNVAWTTLGTEERMKVLGSYIIQAEQLTSTPVEKLRVYQWREALWEWMVQGRKEFLNSTKPK